MAVLLVVVSPSVEKAEDFGASYALVVGIDHYQNPRWPALANGKSDAMAAIAFLESQNYQVTALLDQEATRANILGYFRTYLRERLKGNDRFLFFFNGHGYTEKYGEKDIGYIVPVDGDSSPSLISMDEIREESALLQGAKHQLFILNSCFGGLLGSLTRASGVDPSRPDYLVQITKRDARQFITAGGADQSVVDSGKNNLSWFTYYFLEAVKDGYADFRGDGIITFADLTSYLIPRAANRYQTPASGVLPGDAGGQYVFYAKPAVQPSAGSTPPPKPPEPAAAGSLTHSEDLTKVGTEIEAMRIPIDNLYRAWEQLDLNLYSKQWSPSARQLSKKFNRTYQMIVDKRRKDFARLASVTVDRYQIVYRGYENGTATFDAEYQMTFNFKDGRSLVERERENYKVVKEQGRWVISENRDYIGR